MTFEKLLSIPKSFWVSLHFFSFKDAIKLPVVVRYNTKIQSLKGAVIIKRGGGKDGYAANWIRWCRNL